MKALFPAILAALMLPYEVKAGMSAQCKDKAEAYFAKVNDAIAESEAYVRFAEHYLRVVERTDGRRAISKSTRHVTIESLAFHERASSAIVAAHRAIRAATDTIACMQAE